jgi:hypothetical protein
MSDVATIAGKLGARLSFGFVLTQPEVVWVPRRGNGSRPVLDVSFNERVVLEALIGLLKEALRPYQAVLGLRTLEEPDEDARDRFEQLPLGHAGEVVVMADVASFFEYVDHNILERDIVELAADVDLATAIREALLEVTGREVGIPQGPRSSDFLADLYLNATDRAAWRAGLDVHRFNDDYVFAAADHSDAQQKLVVLETALRDRGLILNHAKTRIVPRSTYQAWLKSLSTRLKSAALEVADPAFYGFDPDEFSHVELGDLSRDAVELAFFEALHDEEPDPYSVNHRVVDAAFALLAAAHSTSPLEWLDKLALDWGAHARNLSLYLRGLIGTDQEGEMVKAVGDLIVADGGRIAPWVLGWLIDALAHSTCPLDAAARAVLRQTLGSSSEPWFVRGRAAVALGRRAELPEQEAMNGLLGLAPVTAQADLVAAVAYARPEWARKFCAGLAADPILTGVAALVALVPVPPAPVNAPGGGAPQVRADESAITDGDIPF